VTRFWNPTRLAVAVWKQQAPGPKAPEAGISELLGAVQALAQAACDSPAVRQNPSPAGYTAPVTA
jgi:hypothetical protein